MWDSQDISKYVFPCIAGTNDCDGSQSFPSPHSEYTELDYNILLLTLLANNVLAAVL